MIENKKEKQQALLSNSVNLIDIGARSKGRNNLNTRVLGKKVLVKDEYSFIVPWQLDKHNILEV